MFSHVGQERSFQECRSNRPRQSRKIVFPWRFYSKATWRIDKQLTWWRDTTRHHPCQPPQHASQRIHSFRVDWDREKWYVLYPDFVLLLHRQRDNVAYIRAADVQRVQEKKRERGKKKKKMKTRRLVKATVKARPACNSSSFSAKDVTSTKRRPGGRSGKGGSTKGIAHNQFP